MGGKPAAAAEAAAAAAEGAVEGKRVDERVDERVELPPGWRDEGALVGARVVRSLTSPYPTLTRTRTRTRTLTRYARWLRAACRSSSSSVGEIKGIAEIYGRYTGDLPRLQQLGAGRGEPAVLLLTLTLTLTLTLALTPTLTQP